MTGRQRILCALAHEEPDLLPIDLGGMRASGISAIAYNRLKGYLEIRGGQTRCIDYFQQLAEVEGPVLDRLGCDVLPVHQLVPMWGIALSDWKPMPLPDGSPSMVPGGFSPVPNEEGGWDILAADGTVLGRRPEGGLYYDFIHRDCAWIQTLEDVERFPLESISEEELAFFEAQARRIRGESDRASLLTFGGNVLEAGEQRFGYERFLTDLHVNREVALAWLHTLTAGYLASLERVLDRVGSLIDIIEFGDDLGTQDGLIISRVMYRQLIMPFHQRQFRLVKERCPHLKILFHCCGAVFELIPDLIEAGIDILNPVQVSARGMDPARLKRDFGSALVFWGGGADMQRTVPFADAGKIARHVQELIEIFAPGGGFVFAPVHNVQADVPPEKIMAIFDTALAYREKTRALNGG